jgi:hypothetical protein
MNTFFITYDFPLPKPQDLELLNSSPHKEFFDFLYCNGGRRFFERAWIVQSIKPTKEFHAELCSLLIKNTNLGEKLLMFNVSKEIEFYGFETEQNSFLVWLQNMLQSGGLALQKVN